MLRFTERIEHALRVAAHLHEAQHRKGDHTPFFAHPVAVAILASEYTDNENIIIAALLHDAVEDTPYTLGELSEAFSPEVAAIVAGVTEPALPQASGWRARREAYIKNLEHAPVESAYVSAADKIHNMTSVLLDYQGNSEEFQKDFAGSVNDRIAVYEKITIVIANKLGADHPLALRLSEVFARYRATMLL